MKEEQAYERLMRALCEMQSQIQGVRPAAKQVGEPEIEMLQSLWEQQKSILKDCLTHIDQTILNCSAKIEEYQQAQSHLAALNERLGDLGAESMVVPEHFPTADLGDLILARLQGLRAKGKI